MAETREIQPRERSDDPPGEPTAQTTTVEKSPREQVLDAFRRWGYLEARLDPLAREELRRHPELALDPDEFPGAEEGRRWYCGTLGVEFMHIPDPERRRWVAEAMEGEPPAEDAERVFEQVLRAETFEQLLQSRYLGTKRFSIEGVAALIPLLAEMLDAVGDHGGRQAVLAMSHRGRLNVMAHIVGTPAEALLAGFEDVDPRSVLGGGDVKYHLGATGPYRTTGGQELHIHLASNPSHLEAIDPVALGRVRAKQQRLRLAGEPGERQVVPIFLHGDAAFAGQGILAETLNLANLDGFSVGGTVHVVVNNRIGFTTEPEALHSGAFATDVARRLPVPIFHVNGEDLRAVVRVARLAIDYRSRFGDDVVVDLVGFRRHGHSEVDDPTITQPLLYKAIDAHPPLADLYGERVGLSGEEIEEHRQAIRDEMDAAQKAAAAMDKKPKLARLPAYWDDFYGGLYDPECEVDTGVAAEELGRFAELLTRVPDGFHLHPKIAKLFEQRAEMGRGERPVDYGFAEALAFGTLLSQRVPVRLSGQDTRRGTFSHRHSVLIDVEDESEHLPLCAIADEAGGGVFFEVYDSMLSEAAVLGFEFGFARDYPEALVGWEAQFGDFVNGAQVIIDQFLVAAEDKWGLLSGVVLLLPHGFEGQGPEHSSARIERFLTLSAESNVQVCQPSTAAQYFHLLRRQALRKWRKPLVVFTPKSMLRHKASSSELAELSRPRFLEVVPDGTVSGAERVLVATGKIVHELEAERARREDSRTAIVAVEQLYPFPDEALAAAVDAHPDAKHIVWVQEEPANMGALSFVMPHLERHARGRRVRSVKRSASGSPATGSAKAHALEQKTLLTLPFEIR
ncbi:MAG TPA: 2-oxoglutarate dehydrogenase E1 component [Thermoanaerobaculia bacterium]|nr:2-oxoglutarate dehydrogenase E1 component [Thermoanaerobaculia bacterium]